MYLSKIGLDIRSASVRQSMRDCGDMHRNVQKLFTASRAEESVLYRVYQNETGCFLYTMSENMPRETQDTLHNGMHILGCKDVSAMEEAFVPGRQLRFNLLTMPFKKVYDGVNKKQPQEIFAGSGREGGMASAKRRTKRFSDSQYGGTAGEHTDKPPEGRNDVYSDCPVYRGSVCTGQGCVYSRMEVWYWC